MQRQVRYQLRPPPPIPAIAEISARSANMPRCGGISRAWFVSGDCKLTFTAFLARVVSAPKIPFPGNGD
jgi:hypothetical protein